jgi:hypothetical protein
VLPTRIHRFLDGPGIAPRALGAGLVVAAVSTIFGVLETSGAFPFSSTDDGPIYFAPLIKAHTDALLEGNPFPYFWNLGSGWSPWETGQVGPLYPAYHLSNLLARAIGEPFLLLEVSAWFHVSAAGAVAFWLLPRRFLLPERLLFALLLAVQPAPLILGANWHDYLTPYPWLLGLLLLLLSASEDGRWTAGRKAALLVFSGLYFTAAHPQMYVIGMGLLVVWRLALSLERRRLLRDVALLVLCQLPAVAPLLFLAARSQEATADWMAFRENPMFMLDGAQTAWVWLRGTFLGNLAEIRDFLVWWPTTSWKGVGVFFAPWLLVSLYSSWRKRDLAWPLAVAVMAVVMAAATFPFVRHLAVGPFAGFRWTWKLAFFLGPIALVTALRLGQPYGPLRWIVNGGLALALVLSVAVTFRGLEFNLLPSLRNAEPNGIVTLVDETREMMAKTGIEPGDRVALVGGFPIVDDEVPLPILGLVGNAPLLAGLESAHMYEPLESAAVARAHFNLSTPWRVRIPVRRYRVERERIEEGLRVIGVSWLVTMHGAAFDGSGEVVEKYRDRFGRATYAKHIGPAPFGFPWGADDRGPMRLRRGADGSLETAAALAEAPEIAVGRAVDWYALEDGRWRGEVRVVHLGWIAATALALLATLLVLRRFKWGN